MISGVTTFFRRPLALFLISAGVFILTPFVVFPEVMGDVGPRNVPLWRNCLGVALLAVAMAGMVFALLQMVREQWKKSQG
jgi:uncharacterized membrane protein YidH (DUF202 family)